jgi:hypothetical protein
MGCEYAMNDSCFLHFILGPLADLIDFSTRTDPDSPRVRTMMEGYEVCEFGPDEELFSDIALYVRKSKTAVAPNTGHCVTCP